MRRMMLATVSFFLARSPATTRSTGRFAGTVDEMEYFTNASTRGRVRYGDLAWTIDIIDSLGGHAAIGTAREVGITPRGLALWELKVHGAEVPNQFIVVDGRFMPFDDVKR
jgi:hypothetical protein